MSPLRGALRVTLACACAGALAGAPPAGADVFGSIGIVSASSTQQADYAHDPAISLDHRYVVFDGSVGGVTGVWRREIGGAGKLDEVAGGDARMPSISADGSRVSFTSNEGASLASITDGAPDPPHPTGEAPNVWVRNMTMSPQEEGAFVIVSAPSGSTEPLRYGSSHPTVPGAVEKFGSFAEGRSAISADGNKVVFVTTEVSNLVAYPQLEAEELELSEVPKPHTPPLQVAVRELDTDRTRLISVRYDPATGAPAIDPQTQSTEPVPLSGQYGAVYSYGGPPKFEEPNNPYGHLQKPALVGASISADGSTVAWMGQQLGEQVPALADETLNPSWGEPLWRRIADGESAPVRRITGGSDPTNPACIASGESSLPATASVSDPCQGPFETQRVAGDGAGGVWLGDVEEDPTPSLSADGYEVAMIAGAPLVAVGAFSGGAEGSHADLYVVDMHPGLSRTAALERVTELATGVEEAVATNAPIASFAISPDGSQLLFSTERSVFPLSTPAYVSAPLAVPGMSELYEVDLADETLTRVTHGFEGGPSEHPLQSVLSGEEDPYFTAHNYEDGALSPSFAADDATLAFSSTASNLVFGDNNTPRGASSSESEGDGADAYISTRLSFSPQPAETSISPAPPNPSVVPDLHLGVSAKSLSGGRVQLVVSVPSGGTLKALARGSVPVPKPGKRGHTKKAVRALAGASAKAGAPGRVTITLRLAKRYVALARGGGGLAATAALTFTGSGQPPLSVSLHIRFRTHGASRPSTARRQVRR
jgi:hypothetical protein